MNENELDIDNNNKINTVYRKSLLLKGNNKNSYTNINNYLNGNDILLLNNRNLFNDNMTGFHDTYMTNDEIIMKKNINKNNVNYLNLKNSKNDYRNEKMYTYQGENNAFVQNYN